MTIIDRLLGNRRRAHPFESLTPIVADGAMSFPFFGDGRLIPALVLDCDKNNAILNMFFLDETGSPPGDVKSTWARSKHNSDFVYLMLDFLRPVETQIVIPFELIKQGGLVDGIINSRGVYLQPKEVGLTVSAGVGKEQKLIEIPATATFPDWDSVYRNRMIKHFKSQGASKNEAQITFDAHICRLRELWSRRRT